MLKYTTFIILSTAVLLGGCKSPEEKKISALEAELAAAKEQAANLHQYETEVSTVKSQYEADLNAMAAHYEAILASNEEMYKGKIGKLTRELNVTKDRLEMAREEKSESRQITPSTDIAVVREQLMRELDSMRATLESRLPD